MVDTQRVVFYPHLNASRKSHLVGVDLGPQTVFHPCHQDPVGIFDREVALFAENIDEIGQLFRGYHRNHFIDDLVDIGAAISAEAFRHGMGFPGRWP